ESPRLPKAHINLRLGSLRQIVRPRIGDHAHDLIAGIRTPVPIRARSSPYSSANSRTTREVTVDESLVHHGYLWMVAGIRSAKTAAFGQLEAHELEVIRCDRAERKPDAITGLRRHRLPLDFRRDRPVVTSQRHAPGERRVLDTG